MRALLGGAALGVAALAPASAQTVVNLGPGPTSVPPFWLKYQGTAASGAVGAIVPSATDANVLYLGSVNGGVWGSTNGGASWTPLTDNQASLSIGGLAIDSTNSSHVVAAIGRVSSASRRGGPLTGLLSSDNGGQSWTMIHTTGFPAGTVANFDALVLAGSTVIAGSNGTLNSGSGSAPNSYGGVYRVDASGAATLIGAKVSTAAAAADPTKPLAAGVPVTDLAVDPHNPNVIYAAVTGAPAAQGLLNGVYQSVNNGQSFTRILDASTAGAPSSLTSASNLRIAAAVDGSVYLVSSTPAGDNSNVDQLLRRDPAGHWTTLPLAPALATAQQGDLHLLISVDPKSSNVIYIGSSPASSSEDLGGASNLFRGVFDPATGNVAYTDIEKAAVNPHSDFRALTFDAAGNLLLGSDGGIYRNSAVSTSASAWQPIMTGYVGGELYAAAWNPVSKTIAGAFQDNGVNIQNKGGGLAWSLLLGADGTNVAVNAVTRRSQGQSLVYGTTQNLGFFQRFTLNAQNNQVTPAVQLLPQLNGANLAQQPFSTKIALNVQDPTYIAMGGLRFYVGQDDLSNRGGPLDPDINASTVPFAVTDVTGTDNVSRGIGAVAFGTREQTWRNALAGSAFDAGTTLGVYVTPDALAANAAMVRLDLPVSLAAVSAIVLDPTQPGQVFAAGARNVFLVQANAACLGGAVCAVRDLGLTLPGSLVSVGAAEAIDHNGVRALFVGGLSTGAAGTAGGNIFDLQDDPTHTWQNTAWQAFGIGLPNVQVIQLAYSYDDDLLSVATLGRGAWVIPDVTSYFGQAAQLVLGNGDFDSTRADVFTDGTTGGRPLVKVGLGTVTLTGLNSYTGGTAFNAGTLQVSSDANLGAASGSLTFNGGTLRNTAGFSSARSVVLNTVGTFDTQAPLELTGVVSGAGGLMKIGPDALTLGGVNTYAGGATLNAGTLAVGVDANLGAASGGLTFNGGTLRNTGAFSSGRAVALSGAGTFETLAPLVLSGTISGPGALVKTGPDRLTLGGVNTYTGGTGVYGGTLAVGTDLNLGASAGGLTLDGGTLLATAPFGSGRAITVGAGGGVIQTQAPLVLNGDVSGPGGLTIAGPQLLVLNGVAHNVGPMTVSAGSLAVNGATGPGVTTVAAGATLGGTGTIGGALVNFGTVAPGAAMTGTAVTGAAMTGVAATGAAGGTLVVAGAFTQASGGVTHVSVGQVSSSLQVGGTVQAGGTIAVDMVGKAGSGTVPVLTTSAPISGTFALQQAATPFAREALVYRPGEIDLTVTHSFTMPATSVNERGAGGALNGLFSAGAQPALDPLFTALDTAPGATAGDADLNQLSGSAIGNAIAGTRAAQALFVGAVDRRLGQLRRGDAGDGGLAFSPADQGGGTMFTSMAGGLAQLAGGPATANDAAGDGGARPSWGKASVWAQALGGWGSIGSDGNTPRATVSAGGLMVGVDKVLSEQWVVGGALGYSSAWARSPGASVFGANDQATVYGGWRQGALFADAQASYTHADYQTRRTVVFGTFGQSAQGKPSGDDGGLVLRVGSSLKAGAAVFEPSVGFDYTHLDRSAFSERGATIVGLRLASQQLDVVQPSIGARVATEWQPRADLRVGAEVRARYFHDVGDGVVPVTASFLVGGGAFTTDGAYPGRDSGRVGAGATVQMSGWARLFVDYDAQFATRGTTHAFSGGFRAAF